MKSNLGAIFSGKMKFENDSGQKSKEGSNLSEKRTQVDEDEQSGHRSGPVSVRSAWLGRDENSEEERKMAKEKFELLKAY